MLINAPTHALENTIYMSFDSKAGQFPNASYQLNQYTVVFHDNRLEIDGKQILYALGMQTIEVFVENNSIHLRIDKNRKIIPKL